MEVKKKMENVKNRIQKTPVLSIINALSILYIRYEQRGTRFTTNENAQENKRLEKCTSHAMNCEFYEGQSEESYR